MTDDTQTNPPIESRPIRVELTMPGPICGCPMVLVIEGQCTKPEHPDLPAECGTMLDKVWLFSPDQLRGAMEELTERLLLGYHVALQHKLKQMEEGTDHDHPAPPAVH